MKLNEQALLEEKDIEMVDSPSQAKLMKQLQEIDKDDEKKSKHASI